MCPKFSNPNIQVHFDRHHPDPKDPNTCLLCGKLCSDPKDLSKHILECNQTSCKKLVDRQLSTSESSKPTNEKPSSGNSNHNSSVKKQGCQTKDEFDRAEKKREEKNQRKRERYAKRRN